MNSENNPLVTIIIVNYNGKEFLQNCLDSISKNKYKKNEIIFVDNNSTDDSVDFVRKEFPSVKIIKLEQNLGYAEPNNIGAKQAKGELLYFLNNDTTICEDSIIELVKIFKEPHIAICQSLLLKPDGTIESSGDFFSTKGLAYKSTTKPHEIKPILSARGASMMIKKDFFWDLGGFDGKFFASFEDVDLGWRAWISGYKVVLAPKSIVYHFGSKTVHKLGSTIPFHGAKNTLILCLTNFELSFAIKSIFSLVSSIIKRKISQSNTADSQLAFNVPSFGMILSAVSWVIKNFKYISKKRTQVKSSRTRTTNELIKMDLITKVVK